MHWSIQQVVDELVQRVLEGPMQFRFILQPAVAACLGLRDGLADFRTGAPPFFPVFSSYRGPHPPSRKTLLRRLRWPVLIATVIDAVVQYLMFGYVRPLSALLVGTTVMALPYSAARSLSNWIRSARRKPRPAPPG